MNRRTVRALALALGLGVAVLGGVATAAEVPKTVPVLNTTFVGQLVYLGDYGPTGATATLRVHLKQLSPAAEESRLSALIERKGEDSIASELGKRDLGYIQIGQRFPERVAAAFLDEKGNERHLTLITERQVSVRELFRSSRSADYRYRVIDLNLDLEGKGAGDMLFAARLESQGDGQLAARNLDVVPSRVYGFRAIKG